jgi:RNA recognition motif-containing protein
MATHQSIRYLQQRASQNGLVIHLGSLNFKAKKTDIEKLFKERGFDKCTFFWPDMPPNQPGEHKGWCRVQFAEKEVAERAKSALQNTPLMGRPIKIGSIENTAVSTDRGTRWPRITLLLMLPRLLLKP